MSEIFNNPHKQEFIVHLPISECHRRLKLLDKCNLDPIGRSNLFISRLEIDQPTEHRIEFRVNIQPQKILDSPPRSSRDINLRYGAIYMKGYCQQKGYETVIHYGFYQKLNQSFYYSAPPHYLFKFYQQFSPTGALLVILGFIIAIMVGIFWGIQATLEVFGMTGYVNEVGVLLAICAVFLLGSVMHVHIVMFPFIKLDDLIHQSFADSCRSKKFNSRE